MKNSDYVNRFNQAGIIIHRMFWIAGSYESDDLKEMIMDIDIEDYEKIIPNVDIESLESYLEDEIPVQIFADNNLWGFIAETRYPRPYDFVYDKKGRLLGNSVSKGIQTVDYVYGETIEELYVNIEKAAKENYKYCLDKEESKLKSLK